MARRRRPNRLINLRDALLTPAYRDRLDRAWTLVTEFARLRNVNLSALAKHRHQIDPFAGDLIQHLFEERHSHGTAVCAALVLQKRLRVRGDIPSAWDAIKSWELLDPPHTRVPMPLAVIEAFLVTGISLALASHTKKERDLWWGCAISSYLGFRGLLRPGELIKLRRVHVTTPSDADATPNSPEWVLILVVEKPKNRRYFGNKQFVIVDDPTAISLVEWWFTRASPETTLFPGSRTELVKHFKTVLRILGLQDCGFTLASLRTGGATHHFQTFRNISLLQYHGRWKSLQTLQHYVQEAMASQTWASIPNMARQHVSAARARFDRIASLLT